MSHIFCCCNNGVCSYRFIKCVDGLYDHPICDSYEDDFYVECVNVPDDIPDDTSNIDIIIKIGNCCYNVIKTVFDPGFTVEDLENNGYVFLDQVPSYDLIDTSIYSFDDCYYCSCFHEVSKCPCDGGGGPRVFRQCTRDGVTPPAPFIFKYQGSCYNFVADSNPVSGFDSLPENVHIMNVDGLSPIAGYLQDNYTTFLTSNLETYVTCNDCCDPTIPRRAVVCCTDDPVNPPPSDIVWIPDSILAGSSFLHNGFCYVAQQLTDAGQSIEVSPQIIYGGCNQCVEEAIGCGTETEACSNFPSTILVQLDNVVYGSCNCSSPILIPLDLFSCEFGGNGAYQVFYRTNDINAVFGTCEGCPVRLASTTFDLFLNIGCDYIQFNANFDLRMLRGNCTPASTPSNRCCPEDSSMDVSFNSPQIPISSQYGGCSIPEIMDYFIPETAITSGADCGDTGFNITIS